MFATGLIQSRQERFDNLFVHFGHRPVQVEPHEARTQLDHLRHVFSRFLIVRMLDCILELTLLFCETYGHLDPARVGEFG